ncbi:MAG: hypothetical protein OHK0046_05910 [Anaerolineae bacterium]
MRVVFRLLIFSLLLLSLYPTQAQTDSRPFTLPVASPPGPDTWLFGQAYGNTVGAFNFGAQWYSSGQGLHFGLDLPMPCGTPLVAVADGIVAYVDNLGLGAGPHNLVIRHDQYQLATLYGHLLEAPPLLQGQAVTQGQVIAQSGDPDITCDSRPHLHFEVRSPDYFTTYNPIDYIDANWHSLALAGGYSYPLFQQDLYNPRQWMSLDEQPPVRFGGRRLNAYTLTWPLPSELRPPTNAPLPRPYEPLSPETAVTLNPIGFDRCCWEWWWDATDADRFYVIDGTAGQQASVIAWSASQEVMQAVVSPAPPAITSPDGAYQIFNNVNEVIIQRTTNPDERYSIQTQGATPAVNPDNSKLTWTVRSRVALPGERQPNSTVYISDLNGGNLREVAAVPGIAGSWLDAHRLLLTVPSRGRLTTLSVYDTRDESITILGTWRNVRNISVAPGGERVLFYVTFPTEEDDYESGVYVIETVPEAEAVLLPWFGSWRWRDAESVYYFPLEPENANQTLAYYHIPTGENRVLAGPANDLYFTVMNGEWEVSPDGRRILFQNALDSNLWMMEIGLQ